MTLRSRGLDPFGDPKSGHSLTRAIIDTIREPLIILDTDLNVIAASRSFHTFFSTTPEELMDKSFFLLGNGQWNIPELKHLLQKVIPEQKIIEDFEVIHDFPKLGRRVMMVNAREVVYPNQGRKMLVSIFDVTKEREYLKEREFLINQKDLLIKEMRHRIANSLQIIANILLLKSKSADGNEEARAHLDDAHQRILAIATVQEQLDPVANGEFIQVDEYLTKLGQGLGRSMISKRNKPLTLTVHSDKDEVLTDTAISLGLLTTELVINAIKHAFPDNKKGKIQISYKKTISGWVLEVSDDGVAQTEKEYDEKRPGLGTSIIESLAKQLGAIINTVRSESGTTVSLAFSAARPE